MPNVTPHEGCRSRPVGTLSIVEEKCPICGGDDIGCLYGDWFLGEDDPSGEVIEAA
jgi:hypothetical protein